MNQQEHKKRAEELLEGYVELLEDYKSGLDAMTPIVSAEFSLRIVVESRELAAVHALLAQIPDSTTFRDVAL